MSDGRDDEIAELKARLAAMETRKTVEAEPRSGTGFSRGFFGCFGVAAAIGLVCVGIVALGQCGNSLNQAPQPEPDFKDFNRLTYAGHCVNALDQAGVKGEINAGRSAMVMPWSILKVDGTDDFPTLECAVTDADRVRFVTVQVICEDDSNETCSRLISVADARAVR